MTECNQTAFAFEAHFSRQVVARFDGARTTTDGGALLLRAVDRKISLLKRVRTCFHDARDPDRVEHALSELLAQRIYALALGYEDLNDHEELRHDPLLGLLAGKRELEEPLAGKSTLNRLELTPVGEALCERYHKITYSSAALDELLVEVFLDSYGQAPAQIVLDLDVTDTPLHGEQEARFFSCLLRALLLSPAVRLLWRASVVCTLAAVEPGRECGKRRRSGTHCTAGSLPLAVRTHHPTRRLRFLPRGVAGLVRKTPCGLCVWLRT